MQRGKCGMERVVKCETFQDDNIVQCSQFVRRENVLAAGGGREDCFLQWC